MNCEKNKVAINSLAAVCRINVSVIVTNKGFAGFVSSAANC